VLQLAAAAAAAAAVVVVVVAVVGVVVVVVVWGCGWERDEWCPEDLRMCSKMTIWKFKTCFSAITNLEFLNQIKGNTATNHDFLKFVIPVRSDYCDYLLRVSKYLFSVLLLAPSDYIHMCINLSCVTHMLSVNLLSCTTLYYLVTPTVVCVHCVFD
jgi:hypothetical protein